jgi:Bacterial alpha-L-rhamnosidase C-terminal domain
VIGTAPDHRLRRRGLAVSLTVEVPANVTATVILPDGSTTVRI